MAKWKFATFSAALIGLLVRLTAGQNVTVMYGPCNTTERCASRQGDIVLGGLFPLHGFDSDKLRCTGSVNIEALQWVEAFRHAVQLVNANTQLLSGVALGFEARDTCSEVTMAVQQSLDFIRGIDSDGGCASTTATSTGPRSSRSLGNSSSTSGTATSSIGGRRPPVVGVVGAYSSSNSIATSDLLGLFNIPMVSYGSTNTRLSDNERFDFFFRVLPSDRFTSVAIAGLIQHFGWRFVSIVYTDDAFGSGGAAAVREELNSLTPRVCVGVYQQLPLHATLDEGEKHKGAYERVLSLLLQEEGDYSKARVVILFVQMQNAKFLLKLASEKPDFVRANLTFIGVDAWGDILTSVEDGQEVAKGSVSAIPFSKNLKLFDKFLADVRPHENHPWLCEKWMELFEGDCDCVHQPEACASSQNSLTSEKVNYRQSSKLALVYDSVLAFAHALNDIKTSFCPQTGVVCDEMHNGSLLRDFLHNVSFIGQNKETSSETFRFDMNGDPMAARYSIKNMIVSDQSGRIDFPVNGVFHTTQNNSSPTCRAAGNEPDSCYINNLSINVSPLWNDGTNSTPVSRCSGDCDQGEYAEQYRHSTPCCWKCKKCTGFRYTENQTNMCKECPPNSTPTLTRSGCLLLASKKWDVDNPLVIVIAVLISLLLSLSVLAAIWIVRNRKKTFLMGIELTTASLAGVIVNFISLAVLLGGPTSSVCAAHEVLLSFGLTVMSFPLALYALRVFSSVMEKNFVARFLSVGKHQLLLSLVHQVIPLFFFLVGYSQDPPDVKEIIKAHSSRSIICSLSPAFRVTIIYNVILSLSGAVLCMLALRRASTVDITDLVYRSLTSTALCGVMIPGLALCSFVIYTLLDDAIAKVGTEQLAILLSVSGVLFLLLLVYLRKFPDILALTLPHTNKEVHSSSEKKPYSGRHEAVFPHISEVESPDSPKKTDNEETDDDQIQDIVL